jgi:hypothetical protein
MTELGESFGIEARAIPVCATSPEFLNHRVIEAVDVMGAKKRDQVIIDGLNVIAIDLISLAAIQRLLHSINGACD